MNNALHSKLNAIKALLCFGFLVLLSTKVQAQTRPIESPRADTVFTTHPVELVHILAWQYYGGGQIEWIVKNQSNSASFEIQQSTNGSNWQVLSSMNAAPEYKEEYGYVYYDANLARYGARRLYYRVRQIAQDGSFTYSPTRTILLSPKFLSSNK